MDSFGAFYCRIRGCHGCSIRLLCWVWPSGVQDFGCRRRILRLFPEVVPYIRLEVDVNISFENAIYFSIRINHLADSVLRLRWLSQSILYLSFNYLALDEDHVFQRTFSIHYSLIMDFTLSSTLTTKWYDKECHDWCTGAAGYVDPSQIILFLDLLININYFRNFDYFDDRYDFRHARL